MMTQRTHLLSLSLAAALTVAACSKEQGSELPANQPVTQPKVAPAKPAVAPPVSKAQGTAPQNSDPMVDDIRETLADMVPDDAILWVEMASFAQLVEAFQLAEGDSADASTNPNNPENALGLLQMMGLPIDRLMRDKPIVLALSLELGQSDPRFSIMLPVNDPFKVTEQLNDSQNGQFKAMAQGDYVVLTNRTVLESKGDSVQAFSNVRGEALFGMRLDLARLMDRYGPQLETGIAMAMDQGRTETSGAREGMEGAMQLVRTLAKGIKLIDVRMNLDGSNLTLMSSAKLRNGSKLTELGSDDSEELASMLRYADLSTEECTFASVRKQAVQFLANPMIDLYETFAVRTERESLRPLYEQALGVIMAESVGFAFTGSDRNLALFVQGVDSQSFVTLLERAVESNVSELRDLTLMAPRKGQDESSRFAQYDWIPNAGTPAVRKLKRIFGQPRMRLRLLGHDQETMATLGEGQPYLNRADIQTMEMPAGFAWAMEQVKGANPAMVSHTRVSNSVFERLLGELTPGYVSQGSATEQGSDAWMTSYLAMGRSEWRMGFQVNLKNLVERTEAAIKGGASLAMPR